MSDDKPEHAGNPIAYKCSVCQQPKERDDLMAKRVTFSTIKPVKMIRSRVVGWVCSTCRKADPVWNSPRYSATPGVTEQRRTAHGG